MNKRSKDITALHKEVKYPFIIDERIFEDAINDLEKEKYHSFQAEKKRTLFKSFTTKIYKDEKEVKDIFKKVVNSVIRSFNSKTEILDLEKSEFIYYDKNIVKVEYLEDEFFFRTTYISNDTIYKDEFFIYPTKNFYKMRVKKIILLPVTRDPMSQYTYMGNWDIRKKFKIYKNQILKGVHS